MMDSFNADATILSIDLNQDEDEVIIEEELPGYTWFVRFEKFFAYILLTFYQISAINIYRTLVVQLD